LKHVDRTKLLCFVLDISKERENAFNDYFVLLEELKLFDEQLLHRPSLIVLNKIDVRGAEARISKFMSLLSETPIRPAVICISAKKSQNIEQLKTELRKLTDKTFQSQPNHIPDALQLKRTSVLPESYSKSVHEMLEADDELEANEIEKLRKE
jgi:GTP-binding protein